MTQPLKTDLYPWSGQTSSLQRPLCGVTFLTPLTDKQCSQELLAMEHSKRVISRHHVNKVNQTYHTWHTEGSLPLPSRTAGSSCKVSCAHCPVLWDPALSVESNCLWVDLIWRKKKQMRKKNSICHSITWTSHTFHIYCIFIVWAQQTELTAKLVHITS